MVAQPIVPLREPEDDLSFLKDLLKLARERARPPWWYSAAECRDVDTETFFVGQGENSRKAKAVCGVCPVIAVCLDFALSECFPGGVFGGMTAKERRAEKRRRRAASAPLLVGA